MKVLIKKFEEKELGFNDWSYVTTVQLENGKIITFYDNKKHEGYFEEDVGKWINCLLEVSFKIKKIIKNNSNLNNLADFVKEKSNNIVGKFIQQYNIPDKFAENYIRDWRKTVKEVYNGKSAIKTNEGVFLLNLDKSNLNKLKEESQLTEGDIIEIEPYYIEFIGWYPIEE